MSEITSLREVVELNSYKIYRKRYIPYEEVDISDDTIVYKDDKLIVTTWKPIHGRNDINAGTSYWFLDKGFKISKLYDIDGCFKHYYCDIARFEINEEDKIIRIIDLLADVIIYDDNTYKVLDIDELLQAYNEELITKEELKMSLDSLGKLLNIINSNEFPLDELSKF